MHPLLHINNLRIDFVADGQARTAVKDVNLRIGRGEIVGIAGESGSGKSVTSLAILQLLKSPPAQYVTGQILFSPDGGEPVDLLTLDVERMRNIRGRQISMVFQEPMTSLNPVFTCGRQVAEAIQIHEGVSWREAVRKTIAAFEQVRLPDPAGLIHRYPHELSGGQKQRVMIAMAVSSHPQLLICDEPTTALDVTVQRSILELLRDLQQETGMAVLFITHDLPLLAAIAQRVVVMNRGEIVEQGTVQEVFSRPAAAYTKRLLAAHPAAVQKTVHDQLLIRVQNLSVRYQARRKLFTKQTSFTALDQISFDVFAGETLGIVGESGCGKTTLGRTLLRLVTPSSGRITYQGSDLLALHGEALRRFRKNMQIVFQDPYSSLNPSTRVGDALSEALMVHFPELTRSERRERAAALLEKVGLDAAHYHRYPHEFSGGQRQRVVIARALAPGPQFVVCDESVSALDPGIQAQVLDLLNRLKTELGFTCVFISHDLSVIRAICDRVIVMNKGKIEESGPVDEIYERPASAYTRKLLAAIPRNFVPSPA